MGTRFIASDSHQHRKTIKTLLLFFLNHTTITSPQRTPSRTCAEQTKTGSLLHGLHGARGQTERVARVTGIGKYDECLPFYDDALRKRLGAGSGGGGGDVAVAGGMGDGVTGGVV